MNYNIHSHNTDEKIKLAEELWESIEAERAVSLSPAQQQLLEKRIMLHQQSPTEGRSWKEIRKKSFLNSNKKYLKYFFILLQSRMLMKYLDGMKNSGKV